MDSWWIIGFAAAAAIVVVVAVLLIAIWWEARRIARLAATTIDILDEIERQTRPIWLLQRTALEAKALTDGLRRVSARDDRARRGSRGGEAA